MIKNISDKDLKILKNGNFEVSEDNENLFINKKAPFFDFYDTNKDCEIHALFKGEFWEISNITNKGKPGYLNENISGKTLYDAIDNYIECEKKCYKKYQREQDEILLGSYSQDIDEEYDKFYGFESIINYVEHINVILKDKNNNSISAEGLTIGLFDHKEKKFICLMGNNYRQEFSKFNFVWFVGGYYIQEIIEMDSNFPFISLKLNDKTKEELKNILFN